MSNGRKCNYKKKLGRRKQQRNRRFWERITSGRYEKILEIARGLTKNLSDAHDLAQTVVLRLLKYCPKPVRITNFNAYIFTTTKNAWIDSQCQKEISLAELEKTGSIQIVVVDPNLGQVLESIDNFKLLGANRELKDTKLLRTIILSRAGYKLPDIAKILNEPVRSTRYRWYRYRDVQRKALLSLTGKNLASTKLQ